MLFPDVGLVSVASLCSASFQQSGFLLQVGEVQPRFSIILWFAFSPEFRAQNKKEVGNQHQASQKNARLM